MSNSLSIYFTLTEIPYTKYFVTRQNIKKKVHHIRYQGKVEVEDTVCAYVGSKEINPISNLEVVDQSDTLDENSIKLFESEFSWKGYQVSSVTKEFLITDVYADYVSSKLVPLYYKHILPDADINPDSVVILNEDLSEVPSYSYKVIRRSTYDETTGAEEVGPPYAEYAVFSNYKNEIDVNTGNGNLYWVRYERSGTTHYEILSSEPAFTEATVDDIWDVSAQLKPWLKVHITSPGDSYYVITVPRGDTVYSIAYLPEGRISLLKPITTNDEEPWFPKITNGSFKRVVNSISYQYSIPEFSNQTFSPLQPYKNKVDEEAVQVRGDVLRIDATPMKVEGTLFDLSILIYDRNDNLLYALTSDSTINGDYYLYQGSRVYRSIETDEAWITWDSSGIVGYDEYGGYIHLARQYPDTYTFRVSYYYEEKNYEFTSLNLNPIFDSEYDEHEYIVYAIPSGGNNPTSSEQITSIHYVKKDRSGRIIETSQTDAATGGWGWAEIIPLEGQYPYYDYSASSTLASTLTVGNTTVYLNSVSSFPDTGLIVVGDLTKLGNDTTIGYHGTEGVIIFAYSGRNTSLNTLTLTSAVLAGTFASSTPVTLFSFKQCLSTTYDTNRLQYFVLAEVSAQPHERPDELSLIDLRKRGGVIKEEYYADSMTVDPRAIWARPQTIVSRGQPIPGNSIAVIRIPYTVLTDYGGLFTTESVEEIVYRHLAAGVLPAIIYYGAIPQLESVVPTTTTLTLTWYPEGTDYSYNVYYSESSEGPWTLANVTPISPSAYSLEYTITSLTINKLYYVAVTAIDSSDIEGPKSTVWGAKTLLS